MQFIKPIPHQSSSSRRIPAEYFDTQALKIMQIGAIYGIDLYYPVVNAIKGNKNRIIWDEASDIDVDNLGLVEQLNQNGFIAEREHVAFPGQGWYKRLVINLK